MFVGIMLHAIYGLFAIVYGCIVSQICLMSISKEEFCARVGFQVRKLRLEKQLSIEKLALEAGMEYTQVSRIELGRINTSIYHIYKISKSLEVTIPEIFYDIQ